MGTKSDNVQDCERLKRENAEMLVVLETVDELFYDGLFIDFRENYWDRRRRKAVETQVSDLLAKIKGGEND